MKTEYFMFCDQDDVWLEDKIEICVNKIKMYNDNIPQMVHTDLFVADSNLNITYNSFVKARMLNINNYKLSRILVSNNVTGCTMLFNRALLDIIKTDDNLNGIILHDWYFNLVCSTFGEVHYIDKPTILYRQHSNNCVGVVLV